MVAKSEVPHFIRKNGLVGSSFKLLAGHAIDELHRLNGRAEVVCGPITTGGWGDTVVNLLVFNHAIEVLQHAGRPMWSQVPYEQGLAELEEKWRMETGEKGYCHPILNEFYGVLFDHEPRLFRRAWFISGDHGWVTSKGAKWEFERMTQRRIPISYFAHEWHCAAPDLSHIE